MGLISRVSSRTYRNRKVIMLIKIKTLTGKEIEINVEPDDVVKRIKDKEEESIPPAQQRLIFSGKQMNDDKTVESYRIQGGSVLHLVLALRGGSEERKVQSALPSNR